LQGRVSDIAAASISEADIDAKLRKALKGMELALKYKKIIDKCQYCRDTLNSAEQT
jgi:hypothetical protein